MERHRHRRQQLLALPASSSPVSVAALVGLVAAVSSLSTTSLAFVLPSSSILPSSSSCAHRQHFTHGSILSTIPTCNEALHTGSRIRGKIRSTSTTTRRRAPSTTTATSLWVSLESPSSAASSSAELHSNSTSSFGTTTLHDDDKDHPHSMEVEASSSTSSSESIQFMEVVMDIPLEETLEQHNNNNFDHTFMGHDNDDLMPHISANDELGINQTISPMTLAPYVSISYDEHGMVQADATTTIAAMMASEYQLATISSAQELQQQEQGADYPAFIQALFQKDANGQTLASKLFNLALLAVSFGYVFVSVFNIDRGMTRGWSPAEIGMRIPLDTWASYENSLSEKPVATKTIINIVIYLLGDWLSQTLFQRKDILDFDAARTLKNGLVGMCFGPAVHEYYEFSDWILPVEGLTLGITNRAFKILMDQTIYLSVKCSIYIIAVGLLNGESVENGTENVKNRLKPIMFTAWKFWPLVHCVTYGLIPARHRILWVNSVDLVWNAILASKARGDDDTTTVAKEESESPPGGGVGGLADKVEDAKENIFDRLGAMFSKFDPSQHQVGEDDDTTTIIVAGNLVEDDIIVASGETMPTTNTSDTMPVLAKNE